MSRQSNHRRAASVLTALSLAALLSSCASSSATPPTNMPSSTPDPRVGLSGGLNDAGKAVSNLRLLSETRPPEKFVNGINSDITFTGKYAIQGSFKGFQIWDISNPSAPVLATAYYCPASQNDVSVYKNLLFVSSEATNGRLDCGDDAPKEAVSKDRLRGIRVFNISDIKNPKYVTNVQTCRGSHTHTVVEDPKDRDNIYIYISGSSPVRPEAEMPGCVSAAPDKDANSALLRIEVIKVPLAHPEQSAIVTTPRIFSGLGAPPTHGEAPTEVARAKFVLDSTKRVGGYTATYLGSERPLGNTFVKNQLDSLIKVRNGSGAPTAADSALLRSSVQGVIDKIFGSQTSRVTQSQCHDITVYPALGLAGGACEGYGLLLDISDPAHPVRLDAAADSNFSYWHSATFNNDGTQILFSDEWGGGGAPKCRASDPKEWGADAIFTIENKKLKFKSYYKIAAPQTDKENCVAHNGSLIPIPGRDVMVQSWYQGGISVFDWTDASHPKEIAFFDRGPIDSTRFSMGGSWSVYWYNGAMYSSEIARGLDIAELTPSQYVSQNEIDAAKTVHYDQLNAQGQPKMVWPPSFALARAYVDQLERNKCLSTSRIASVRADLSSAEQASAAQRQQTLSTISSQLANDARNSCDAKKVQKLEMAVRDLGSIRP